MPFCEDVDLPTRLLRGSGQKLPSQFRNALRLSEGILPLLEGDFWVILGEKTLADEIALSEGRSVADA